MFSLSCAIWAWLTESANILLDLANAGREAQNPFVIAIVSALALIRFAAFLLVVIPTLAFLKRQIWAVRERQRKGEWEEETSVRVFIIILLIVSIAFEVWVSPERRAADADNAPRIEAGDSP